MAARSSKDRLAEISTPLGDLRGVVEDGVASFKGIPYARPPIGDLSFAPTMPADGWNGVRDATRFGPAHTQLDDRAAFQSLDSLTLNVWTPVFAIGSSEKLPVYLFIHGGAYAVGSGSSPTFSSEHIARRGAVAITINYRLNAYGFLATRATYDKYGTTGCWGILDMIAALKWTRDCIAAFGGDPSRVTIGGESSGSFAVSSLILSPLARGLFSRAIMESGSIFSVMNTDRAIRGDLDRSIAQGADLLSLLDIPDTEEGLARLREVDPMLLASIARFSTDMTTSQRYLLFSTLDGAVIPRDPTAALEAGEFAHVPILWGFNADEGTFFIPDGIDELTAFRTAASSVGLEAASAIFSRFPVDDRSSAASRARDMVALGYFASGMKRIADAHARAGVDVYGYRYDYVSAANAGSGLGAYHSAELENIFAQHPYFEPDEDDRAIDDEMQTRFVNFIKNGDPNKGERSSSAVEWPRYETSSRRLLRFDRKIEQIDFPRLDDVIFFEKFFR